jgi:integrase
MARKVRHSSLETRTARLKLAVRRKPYSGPSLSRGVALQYRRNKTKDHQFGLLADTLAITGARPSQAARLRVEDLHDHPVRPKLAMPKGGKGGSRNRSAKKAERYSMPITVQLAAKLKQAAKGRADDAPLLLQSDGNAWGDNPGQRYHREVGKVVTAIGLDPDEVTMYCLRHSSIVRALLLNVPIRVVASLHNTSVAMIERTYSKYITEHSDDISRKALLQDEPPSGENVVALAS